MTVKNAPVFSIPTSVPASEGKARRRNPFGPTASITLRINRCGWEAGDCDEDEVVDVVGVEDVEVEGVEDDGDVLDVDDGVDVEGVEVDGADVDDDDVLEDDVVEVDAGEVPGTCCTYHAATYP